MKKENKKPGTVKILVGLIFLEVIVFIFLFFSAIFPYVEFALAGVGEDNVTVVTTLTIGNVPPEVLSVSINQDAAGIDLSPNSTVIVTVNISARDFNGEGDVGAGNISSEFFDLGASAFGNADDNNDHYSNNTFCTIDYTHGDQYEFTAECTFSVWYYANNATWNSTVTVTDNASLTAQGDDLITVNTLLALVLPDNLDYGTVNATEVSKENQTDVTNAGNVLANLSLSGYAVTVNDGLAMNCTLGATKNISIDYEKYNLTAANTGVMNLSALELNYTNLTSSAVTTGFNVAQRQNDTAQHLDDTNSTYWRIYVPIGVAGSCTGNIVFGAVQNAAT